jgi:hypothetical protein
LCVFLVDTSKGMSDEHISTVLPPNAPAANIDFLVRQAPGLG